MRRKRDSEQGRGRRIAGVDPSNTVLQFTQVHDLVACDQPRCQTKQEGCLSLTIYSTPGDGPKARVSEQDQVVPFLCRWRGSAVGPLNDYARVCRVRVLG